MCARGPPAAAQFTARLGTAARTAPEFATGVAGPDSVRLYRAIVAEADRMPGLGRLFLEGGAAPSRCRYCAELWAEDHDAATAPIVAEQLVQLALGDAYQELVLGTGSPGPEIFERQIDAALALVELTPRRLLQRKRTARGPSASGPRSTITA